MTKRKTQLVIKEADFLFGAPSADAIPKQGFPEIAVIGRSNVGKSSFVNRLLGRRVAKVSSTPGCTRQLNFFRVRGELAEQKFHIALVDLPGFGFAKLSKQEREAIGRSAVEYIRHREQLQLVLLLNDSRRTPSTDELAVQRLCADADVSCLVVATKVDTLNQKEKARSLPALAKGYHLEVADLILSDNESLTDPIWERILATIELY